MTKNELINKIADETSVSKGNIAVVLEAFMGAIKEEVKAGNQVQLKEFCTFGTKIKAARIGRNPRTGDPINIPERTVVVVKPSKLFLGD